MFCHTNGYVRMRLEDGSLVYEHRWVMEQLKGRPLERHEHVHHIDGDKTNNSPINLEVLDWSTHTSHHYKQKRQDALAHR